MKNSIWLSIFVLLVCVFLIIITLFNFYLDTYGVRLSLFSAKKEVGIIKTIEAINEHIFKTEYIFRHPQKFDSFIFGSSRTAVINPANIEAGKYYNMSYSQGLPFQHLSILKALLKKGVNIETVIIGLDEFSFNISPAEHEKQLLRIMHPFVTGRNIFDLFSTYFLRIPKRFEISNMIKQTFGGRYREKFILNEQGMHLFWLKHEQVIKHTNKPLFTAALVDISPLEKSFDETSMEQAVSHIRDIILLGENNNFKTLFIFNPFYKNLYIANANYLFFVKQKIASVTDFYDFSGLNSVTLNDMNYYEISHYRYLVGDMMMKKIFGVGHINVPRDFGVLVTKKNVDQHIERQKLELKEYRDKYSPNQIKKNVTKLLLQGN